MEGVAIDVQTEGTNAVATETGEGCNPDLNYCCNKVAGARLMSENGVVLHAIILLQGYTAYPHYACSRFVAFDNQVQKRRFILPVAKGDSPTIKKITTLKGILAK